MSARTALGPLTAVWTPPPICAYGMATCATCTRVWQGQSCNPERNAHDWTDCWPPRTSGVAPPGVMMGWGFYSPGVSCPLGYATVAVATQGGRMGWSVEFEMESGETAVACCPTGYSVSSVVATGTTGQTCIAVMTSSSFSTVQCNSGILTDFSLVTVPASDRSTYTVLAPLFQLNYKASDRPVTSTTQTGSSTETSGTGSPSPSGSSSSPGSPAQTASDPPGGGDGGTGGGAASSGLSLGAKVGIGVGSALALLLLGLLALLMRRAAQRRRAARPVGELLPDEKKPIPGQPELGGTEVKELEAVSRPQELQGSAVPPASAAGGSLGAPGGGGVKGDGMMGAAGLPGGLPDHPVFELEGSRPGTGKEGV